MRRPGLVLLRGHSRWRGRTVRLRLTLLYGVLFLVSGTVLLGLTYLLVRHNTPSFVLVKAPHSSHHRQLRLGIGSSHPVTRSTQGQEIQQARAQAAHDQAASLHQLLVQSAIALGFMAVVSIALGWVVAGRVLRPLRMITSSTRDITEYNLHERLELEAPHDELRDLANTINDLLARLENAFGAQRRFVANAGHELRTPLTLMHALLDELLTDPDVTIDSFRATSRRLLSLSEEQAGLLEALLTLASSERGLDNHEQFDLAPFADELLLAAANQSERLGLQIHAELSPAPTSGDPVLAKRLVANLIDNAVQHNLAGGRIDVSTGIRSGRPFVAVANTGPQIAADELERLFEPFQRLGAARTGQTTGHYGLGLSIVSAIACAHQATLKARAQPQGGISIEVALPASTSGERLSSPGRHRVIRRAPRWEASESR
jgi:signal transduction histidine kinase